MAFAVAVGVAGAPRTAFNPLPGPCPESGGAIGCDLPRVVGTRAGPPRVAEAGKPAERAGALATGTPLVGGATPREPPAVVPLDRVGAVGVAEDPETLTVVVTLACETDGVGTGVDPVVTGTGVEGAPGPTTGTGTVGTGTGVAGSGGVVGTMGTVGTDGGGGSSTVTGPMVAVTDADGTAAVAVGTSPADASTVAICDTPIAQRHKRAGRARAPTERLESVRPNIRDRNARLNIPDEGGIPTMSPSHVCRSGAAACRRRMDPR